MRNDGRDEEPGIKLWGNGKGLAWVRWNAKQINESRERESLESLEYTPAMITSRTWSAGVNASIAGFRMPIVRKHITADKELKTTQLVHIEAVMGCTLGISKCTIRPDQLCTNRNVTTSPTSILAQHSSRERDIVIVMCLLARLTMRSVWRWSKRQARKLQARMGLEARYPRSWQLSHELNVDRRV